MMKDLMQEVTHTRWAKVELTCTGENRFDVVFHTRRVPVAHTENQFHAGDFRIEKWNLTSREVYSLIRHYFSTLANNGYEKLTDKVMKAIVDLRQTYFLTVENRMDHIHQQANEENAARDIENASESSESGQTVSLHDLGRVTLKAAKKDVQKLRLNLQHFARPTDETITKEMIIEEGYNIGSSYNESIYILKDGSLVDGDCQEGVGRCEDHRMMESFSEFDRFDGNKFWEDIMRTKGLLMIVPECEDIYIHPKYSPTKAQENVVTDMKRYGFTVNKFE